MFKKSLRYLAISLVFLLTFQNCGNNASFTREVGEASVGINDSLGTGDPDDDLDVIEKACDTLPLQTEVVNVQFPKPDMTCEWGVNGNLDKRNQFFQARIEQPRTVGLPKGAVICDASFAFAQQDFLYDDHFLLLFNDTVIAASYDFSYRLDQGNFGLLQYDWNKLAGMDWLNDKEQIFCPNIMGGQSTCSFPGHDQQGVINLNYSPSFIRGIMSTGIPSQHSFTMVSVGDNDSKDCEHSDVEFDVAVSYVIPE